MSVGIYIVITEELQEVIRYDGPKSLNELLQLDYSKKDVMNVLKGLGIDNKELNPEEKVFYIDNTPFPLSFELFKDTGGETITKYVQSDYCYEILIDDSNKFYSDFIEYLKKYNSPFELWNICESSYTPERLKTYNFTTISEENLKKVINQNGFLTPTVGRYYCYCSDSNSD